MRRTRFGVLGLKVHFKDTEPDRNKIEDFIKNYDGEIVNYTMEKVLDKEYVEYRYEYDIKYRGFIDRIKFIDNFRKDNNNIIYIKIL